MKIAKNISELIGKTPLVELGKLNTTGAKILLKLEFFNPLASIKDRIAHSMIVDAEQRGVLTPNTTIIEPTSGNTGIGLAFLCAQRGYKLILTMPETMSVERRKLLQIFGAELVLTEGSKGMTGAITKANELHEEIKDSIILQQFANPANPHIHEKTTAQEILNDTNNNVDIFIAAVGTGGTLTGVGKVLKEQNSDIKVIAVEPETSSVLSGNPPGPHKIQGIGAGFKPEVLDLSNVDEIITIKDEDAGSTSRALAKNEGILAGISAGANICAALEVASRPENKGKTIVTIVPDTGERYLSTWLFDEI